MTSALQIGDTDHRNSQRFMDGFLQSTAMGSGPPAPVEKATYSVSADCIGTATYPDGQKATSFISPDGSCFVDTIKAAPGSQPAALSGSELRVAP